MSVRNLSPAALQAFEAFCDVLAATGGSLILKGKTADRCHTAQRTWNRRSFIKSATDYAITTPTVRAWPTEHVLAFCKFYEIMPVIRGGRWYLTNRLKNDMGETEYAKLAGTPKPEVATVAVDGFDEKKVEEIAEKAATTKIAEKLEAGLEKIGVESARTLAALAASARDEMLDLAEKVRPLELVSADGNTSAITGIQHADFEKVLKLCAVRLNILLIGPAGCGKSHMAGQVADALQLPFYFINCSEGMSESKLEGYLAPTGTSGRFEFITTDFIRAFEDGGVFLMDEVDACDPNVLLILNAALANGHIALPKRYDNPVAKRHEDFVLIASANTYGTGANRMYVGRNQLDEATLDRFRMGQVEMDFDRNMETSLVDDDEIRNAWWKIRDACDTNRIRRVISTRTMAEAATRLRPAGFDLTDMLGQLTMGWSPDELSRVGLTQERKWA